MPRSTETRSSRAPSATSYYMLWSTSFRTRAARSGNWFHCSSNRGRRAWTRLESVDLHRRRSQTVDLSISATRKSRCCRMPGHTSTASDPMERARQSISRSFRAAPELLGFVNEICAEMTLPARRPDAFVYAIADRFPDRGPRAIPAARRSASRRQMIRTLARQPSRRKSHGSSATMTSAIARRVCAWRRPGDIAILFRSRTSHREFEQALAEEHPGLCLQGTRIFRLGRDQGRVRASQYLAHRNRTCVPQRFSDRASSGCRTRAWRRWRRISPTPLPARGWPSVLDAEDRRVLELVRQTVSGWLSAADRIPPAKLFEQVLTEGAYPYELRGRRRQQAWENLKKMRGLVRRIQNRGYATLARIADHIDSLSAGDESNARARSHRCREPDDDTRVERARIPDRLYREHGARSGRPAAAGAGHRRWRERPAVGVGQPVHLGVETSGAGARAARNAAPDYVAFTRARDRLYLSSLLKTASSRLAAAAWRMCCRFP